MMKKTQLNRHQVTLSRIEKSMRDVADEETLVLTSESLEDLIIDDLSPMEFVRLQIGGVAAEGTLIELELIESEGVAPVSVSPHAAIALTSVLRLCSDEGEGKYTRYFGDGRTHFTSEQLTIALGGEAKMTIADIKNKPGSSSYE